MDGQTSAFPMSVFFDTSVLVPVFLEAHEHHEPSLAAFLEANKGSAYCAAHSLAEFYSTFTRLPAALRLSGPQVLLFLENIRERLTIVDLTSAEYISALEAAAAHNIVGGAIYDLLLARAALKSGAEMLLTWNIKHFTRFGPDIASRVLTPSR
ncbi:MAG: PIN domain-containing protein [Candidatus Acidiferrum sp.]